MFLKHIKHFLPLQNYMSYYKSSKIRKFFTTCIYRYLQCTLKKHSLFHNFSVFKQNIQRLVLLNIFGMFYYCPLFNWQYRLTILFNLVFLSLLDSDQLHINNSIFISNIRTASGISEMMPCIHWVKGPYNCYCYYKNCLCVWTEK